MSGNAYANTFISLLLKILCYVFLNCNNIDKNCQILRMVLNVLSIVAFKPDFCSWICFIKKTTEVCVLQFPYGN